MKSLSLMLFTLGGVLLSSACGQLLPQGSATKVINAAAPHGMDNYPEVYMIRRGSYRCSGTLITPNVVLTAAHCVFEASKRAYRVDVETQEGVLKSDTFVFPDFNPDERDPVKRHRHDLALIRLSKALSITPRKLAAAAPMVNDALVIVGYGQTGMAKFGNGSGYKRFGSNTVANLDSNFIYFDGLAASDPGRPGVLSSAYHGDSGGPVMDKNGELMGVISWGTSDKVFERDGETMTTSVAVDITTEESRSFIQTTLEKIKDPHYRECFFCFF